MGARRAFTLIELLVVVAIIAILLSLMAPTVSRMMVLTQKDTCYSNIHHLSIAWVNYATNNNMTLVMGCTGGSWAWAYYGDETYTGDPNHDNARYNLITSGKLFPYSNEVRYYLCPADPTKRVRSYSITSMMNGQDWGGMPYVVRYTDIKDPAYSMVFCDEKDYRSNSNMGTFAQDPKCWGTNHWVDYVATFHDMGDNYGFADGHAEWWKWQDQRTLDGSRAQQFYWPDNGNTDLVRIRKAYFNEMEGAW